MSFHHESPPMHSHLTVAPHDMHERGSMVYADGRVFWLTRDESLELADELIANANREDPGHDA